MATQPPAPSYSRPQPASPPSILEPIDHEFDKLGCFKSYLTALCRAFCGTAYVVLHSLKSSVSRLYSIFAFEVDSLRLWALNDLDKYQPTTTDVEQIKQAVEEFRIYLHEIYQKLEAQRKRGWLSKWPWSLEETRCMIGNIEAGMKKVKDANKGVLNRLKEANGHQNPRDWTSDDSQTTPTNLTPTSSNTPTVYGPASDSMSMCSTLQPSTMSNYQPTMAGSSYTLGQASTVSTQLPPYTGTVTQAPSYVTLPQPVDSQPVAAQNTLPTPRVPPHPPFAERWRV